MQLKFVKSCVGNLKKKQILDIGCATGELAYNLAENGAKVTGIDLNKDLLNQAKTNKKHPNLRFQAGNMLELKNDFQPQQFDAILCFGNTLVHLQSEKLIRQMLQGVFHTLKPDSTFLMQILNYDFILKKRVSKLPLIETENIKFIRKYYFEKDNSLIRFQTELHLKKEGKIVSNETSLLALKSKELVELIKDTGFINIELSSNFKQEKFGGEHLPLVVKCGK